MKRFCAVFLLFFVLLFHWGACAEIRDLLIPSDFVSSFNRCLDQRFPASRGPGSLMDRFRDTLKLGNLTRSLGQYLAISPSLSVRASFTSRHDSPQEPASSLTFTYPRPEGIKSHVTEALADVFCHADPAIPRENLVDYLSMPLGPEDPIFLEGYQLKVQASEDALSFTLSVPSSRETLPENSIPLITYSHSLQVYILDVSRWAFPDGGSAMELHCRFRGGYSPVKVYVDSASVDDIPVAGICHVDVDSYEEKDGTILLLSEPQADSTAALLEGNQLNLLLRLASRGLDHNRVLSGSAHLDVLPSSPLLTPVPGSDISPSPVPQGPLPTRTPGLRERRAMRSSSPSSSPVSKTPSPSPKAVSSSSPMPTSGPSPTPWVRPTHIPTPSPDNSPMEFDSSPPRLRHLKNGELSLSLKMNNRLWKRITAFTLEVRCLDDAGSLLGTAVQATTRSLVSAYKSVWSTEIRIHPPEGTTRLQIFLIRVWIDNGEVWTSHGFPSLELQMK